MNGREVEVLDSRNIGGYHQWKYMSGYDIAFWHCDCGEFGTHPCTPNICKHVEQIED